MTVGAVLRAVEGTATPFEQDTRSKNGHGDELSELWRRVGEAVSQVVDSLTFGELAARAAERRAKARPMYHI